MIMFYEEHDLVRARISKNHQKIVNNSLNRLTKTAISKQIVFNNDFKSVSSQRKPEEECTRHPNVTIAENIYEKIFFGVCISFNRSILFTGNDRREINSYR